MLKYYNYDIVFAEIPKEVTLAINITNCPNRCVGCHSEYLQEDIGVSLDESELRRIVELYSKDITCVCFMGGDAEPEAVEQLAWFVRKQFPSLKTAWYSGRPTLTDKVSATSFHYIKIGGYDASKGPLNNPNTNQRLFSVAPSGEMTDITQLFWRK